MNNQEYVALQFKVPGKLYSISEFGAGNVNDTYLAVFNNDLKVTRIVLQKINSNVFPKPILIMENMRAITDHLASKVGKLVLDEADRKWSIPSLIPCKDGADYFMDPDGHCWRAITLVKNASAYTTVQSVKHAREAGTVLGFFHKLISGIDTGSLHDTLPGFHICPSYLADYDAIMSKGLSERCTNNFAEVSKISAFIEKRRKFASVLEDAKEKGVLAVRPIHGDPKIDNIMIDDDIGMGISIIDLDTVKPGLIHYDFGDALRSLCNKAGENAKDLDSVSFDTGIAKAFIEGYVKYAGDFLTEMDRHYLYDAIRMLPFELGLRFFKDYLAGDVYFKVKYQDHNLQRAKVQFRLCESIESRESEIRRILKNS